MTSKGNQRERNLVILMIRQVRESLTNQNKICKDCFRSTAMIRCCWLKQSGNSERQPLDVGSFCLTRYPSPIRWISKLTFKAAGHDEISFTSQYGGPSNCKLIALIVCESPNRRLLALRHWRQWAALISCLFAQSQARKFQNNAL